MLWAGADAVAAFLQTWSDWRADAHRPTMLHFVALASQEIDVRTLLTVADDEPGLNKLVQALQSKWPTHSDGADDSFHRLALEDGRVLLTLRIGALQAALGELEFDADSISCAPIDLARHAEGGSGGQIKIGRRLAPLVILRADDGVEQLHDPERPQRVHDDAPVPAGGNRQRFHAVEAFRQRQLGR